MTYFTPTPAFLKQAVGRLPDMDISDNFKARFLKSAKNVYENGYRHDPDFDEKKVDFEFPPATDAEWKLLLDLAKDVGDRSMEMQLSMHYQSLTNGLQAKLNNLRSLPNMIVRQLSSQPRMWVFKKLGMALDGMPLYQPFIFVSAEYNPPRHDTPASVSVSFKCHPMTGKSITFKEDNYRGYGYSRNDDYWFESSGHLSLRLSASDLQKKRLVGLFQEWGLELYNDELYARYQKSLAHFEELCQLRATPVITPYAFEKGQLVKKPQAVMFPADWATNAVKLQRDLSSLRKSFPNDVADSMTDDELAAHEVPILFTQNFFCLTRHENFTAHSDRIELYKFRKDLGDKLILPDNHRDLIEALLDTDSLVFNDFTEGKGNSSVILCGGSPGLGKTLTAEIFSEMSERPLFRIPCGILGTDYETIEKRLGKLMTYAAEWGAIMLLDEADLLVRSRAQDFEQNAIVSVMLRLLEFYPGVIFMTTNLLDIVDEAVLSRCIALIKYEPPATDEVRTRLWSSLWDQFLEAAPADKVGDKTATIADMVRDFPNASGRSIKELLKLTLRYVAARDGERVDTESLKRFAQFRAM